MKSVGKTKAIRIYPMPDPTYKIMWKIHPPESCLEEFGKEDWAQSKEELADKINKIGERSCIASCNHSEVKW
jgi:hypothetical protein